MNEFNFLLRDNSKAIFLHLEKGRCFLFRQEVQLRSLNYCLRAGTTKGIFLIKTRSSLQKKLLLVYEQRHINQNIYD